MAKKKKSGLLVCPNPIGMTGGTSCGLEAVHGIGVAGESIKKESTIDYPVSETLCPEVWDKTESGYVIKEDIKQKALELVDKFLAKYKVEATGVNVVGSICSNQYTDDADVDIHIQVDLPPDTAEKLNNLCKME